MGHLQTDAGICVKPGSEVILLYDLLALWLSALNPPSLPHLAVFTSLTWLGISKRAHAPRIPLPSLEVVALGCC